MKKIIIFILIIILAVALFFLTNPLLAGKVISTGKVMLTGKVIDNNQEYSHTKAVCNETNFCQDYEITCKNKEVMSIKPITGAVIQHTEDWKDPRNKSKDLCS